MDRRAGVIEFDGTVPIDPHDPETPHIYLEVVVCSPDSREHESLVMTKAKPSHVHAALLLIGAEPGSPGRWRWNRDARRMEVDAPTGQSFNVTFLTTTPDGRTLQSNPADWIVDVRDGITLRERTIAQPGTASAGTPSDPTWVFAGSAVAPRPDAPGEYYKADIEGTLVGLATFGTETLAWPVVISPEAAVQSPEWIANRAVVPQMGTKVTVRLTRAQNQSDPIPSDPTP